MTTKRLTNEQVTAIADRLDEIVGKGFHDAVCEELNGTAWCNFTHLRDGIADEDVYKIKNELALGYLNEYKQYYDNKHESNS